MTDEKWITIVRRNGKTTTQLSDESYNYYVWKYASERAATPEEIAAEISRRQANQDRVAAVNAFRNREDYNEAQQIRAEIDSMDYSNHPLDRLTLDEWRALRIKICGE